MRTIDPIAHIRRRSQRLKAMQKAGRDIQMSKIVVVEEKMLLTTECRRGAPYIDQYVVDGAVRAPDKLRLAGPRSTVHSAHDTLGRTGLRVLDEPSRHPWLSEMRVEEVGIESTREESTLVAKGFGCEYQNVGEISGFDVHGGMVP